MARLLNNRNDLLAYLRSIEDAHPTVDVSDFKLIGLDDIQAAYADRWPERKDRIFEVCTHFLMKRLDDLDVLIKGANRFVVLYLSASPKSSQQRAKELSRELNAFILGELRDPMGPRAHPDTRTMPTRDFITAVEDRPAVPPEDIIASGPREWMLQPHWNVKREAMCCYYVTPMLKGGEQPVPGYFNDPVKYSANFFAQVDMESLKQSEILLREFFSTGKHALVGVYLHIQTLTNTRTRSDVLTLLKQLSPRLAQYRVLTISSIPVGFPSHYLLEIKRILDASAPNVCVSFSLDEADFDWIGQLNASSIGVAFPPRAFSRRNAVLPKTLLDRLKHMATVCHHSKTMFHAGGDFNSEVAEQLIAIGADYLLSPQIWPPIKKANGVKPWPASNLNNIEFIS